MKNNYSKCYEINTISLFYFMVNISNNFIKLWLFNNNWDIERQGPWGRPLSSATKNTTNICIVIWTKLMWVKLFLSRVFLDWLIWVDYGVVLGSDIPVIL